MTDVAYHQPRRLDGWSWLNNVRRASTVIAPENLVGLDEEEFDKLFDATRQLQKMCRRERKRRQEARV